MPKQIKSDQNLVTRASNCRRNFIYAAIALSPIIGGYFLIGDEISEQIRNNHSNSAELTEPFNETAPAVTTPQEFTAEVNDVVQEALDPQAHGVEGLHQNSDGDIYYHDWFVSDEIYEANILTAQITGLPLSYTYAVQSLESSFNADSFNGIRACGLAQFVPTTLAEKAYQLSETIGYEGVRDTLIIQSVDRYDDQNRPYYVHNYANDLAQHAMVQACWDPDFNTRLAAVMQIQDIGRLQRNLADLAPEGLDYFPVTELQAYTAHFAGRGAAQGLIRDLIENDGTANATQFYSSRAIANATNQRLLFHPQLDDAGQETGRPDLDNPRSVSEFFSFLADEKGLSNTPLPDFTDWQSIEATIAQNMADLDVATVTIEPVTALVYSSRPETRPAGLADRMAEAVTPQQTESGPSGAVELSMRPQARNTPEPTGS